MNKLLVSIIAVGFLIQSQSATSAREIGILRSDSTITNVLSTLIPSHGLGSRSNITAYSSAGVRSIDETKETFVGVSSNNYSPWVGYYKLVDSTTNYTWTGSTTNELWSTFSQYLGQPGHLYYDMRMLNPENPSDVYRQLGGQNMMIFIKQTSKTKIPFPVTVEVKTAYDFYTPENARIGGFTNRHAFAWPESFTLINDVKDPLRKGLLYDPVRLKDKNQTNVIIMLKYIDIKIQGNPGI